MGEKGSLKNRIKDFFKIQKKLLEKKKKEKALKKKLKKQKRLEKQKIYYSKPKIIITKIIGYLGSWIGYFFTTTKIKKDNQKSKITKKRQENLNQFNKIEKKESIQKNKSSFLVNQKVKRDTVISTKKDKNYAVMNSFNATNKNLNRFHMNNDINLNEFVEKEIIYLETNIDKVKKNEELNDLDKKIKQLRKLTTSKNLTIRLANLDYKLKQLKEKIENNIVVKQETKIIKEPPFKTLQEKMVPPLVITGALGAHLLGRLPSEITKNLKLYHDEQKASSKTNFISEKQKEAITSEKDFININDEFIKETSIDDNSNEIKRSKNEISNISNITDNQVVKEELEPFYISLIEIQKAHELVESDRLKQEAEIEKIQNDLNQMIPEEKKKTILSIIRETTSKLLYFNILFPFSYLFKNKFIFGLTNSIILNHRIKKMNRVIKEEKKEKYYNIKKILKEITDKKDILIKTIHINLNTLEEIENLKIEILKTGNNSLEAIKILNNLSTLEKQIIEKNKTLESELEKTKKLEKKGKIKIKKIA